MAKQTINIGTSPNDGTGDTAREGGDKINDNFTELYDAEALNTTHRTDTGADDHTQYLRVDGTRAFTGGQTFADTVDAIKSGDYTLQLKSGSLYGSYPDGETEVAFSFDTSDLYGSLLHGNPRATTSKLLSIKNNGTERFYIDGNGGFYHLPLDATTNTLISSVVHNSNSGVASGLRQTTMELGGTGAVHIDNYGSYDLTPAEATGGVSSIKPYYVRILNNGIGTSTVGYEVVYDSDSVEGAGFVCSYGKYGAVVNDYTDTGFQANSLTGVCFKGNHASEVDVDYIQLLTGVEKKFNVDGYGNIFSLGAPVFPRGTIGRYQNLLRNSEDLSAWTKSGAQTINDDAEPAPDGQASSADELVPVDNGYIENVSVDHTTTASQTFRFTVWTRSTTNSAKLPSTISIASGNEESAKTGITSGSAGYNSWILYTITHTFSAGSTGAPRVRINGATSNSSNHAIWGANLHTDGTATPKIIGYSATGASSNQPDGWGQMLRGEVTIAGRDSNSIFIKKGDNQSTNNLFEAQDTDGTSLAKIDASGNLSCVDATTTGARITGVTRQTTTYQILVSDHKIFGNTDGGSWTATLPNGAQGQSLEIINTGSSGNVLTVTAKAGEDLLGVTADSFNLNDGESLELTYDTTDGWY